jgi:hypothetical protein
MLAAPRWEATERFRGYTDGQRRPHGADQDAGHGPGGLAPARPWIPGIQGSIPEPQRAENLPASADLRPPQLVAGICVPGDAIALRQLLERSGPASSAQSTRLPRRTRFKITSSSCYRSAERGGLLSRRHRHRHATTARRRSRRSCSRPEQANARCDPRMQRI